MQTVKQTKYPGWRTMTSAQRRNAKMEAIFEEARRNGVLDRLHRHEGPTPDIHCAECGSTNASVKRDADLMEEAQGFPVPEPFCCEVLDVGVLANQHRIRKWTLGRKI